MRDKKKRKIIEIIGILFSIVCIIAVLNVGKIQKLLYEKDRYIPFHNLFYEDRIVSISNSGEKLIIYDGIALLLRDIETSREEFIITLESRGVIKDIVWSQDDNYIVYLKDEFNNAFSIWAIDVADKTNRKISDYGEYSDLSWLNSVSPENFTYAKYKNGEDKPTYYSTNLEYHTSEVINNEKKYDEIGFDRSGNQILALKSNKLGIQFYNPSNEDELGSISIVDSASAGYFEIIDQKAYFTMMDEGMLNLYSFDGGSLEIVKKDIDKNLKIEKTLLINGEFAGIYGVNGKYTWLIEDKYKNDFMFTMEKDIKYRFLNSSANGELMLVRPTKDFDPGDISLVDTKSAKVKEIINIRNFISEELLYYTETIRLSDDNSEDLSVTNFTLTLGNSKYSDGDLFIMLDSDLTKTSIEYKYDPLVQSMVDRGINVASISYDYAKFKNEDFTIENQSKKISSDIKKVVEYLRYQKNIEKSKVHLIAKGKSALIATMVLSNKDIEIVGLVLLEPVFDIKNSPYISTIEKSIVKSYGDYPDIDSYIKKYSVDHANFIVYLNTKVSDSDITNEFYKNTRKTTENYLYKKAGVYNEHNIGSTYLLEEYFEKFVDN
ncbi:MAG: hypothetical protein WBA54_01265 [Acidaminobacteraceae bacterium]